jgi:hypothetical protein
LQRRRGEAQDEEREALRALIAEGGGAQAHAPDARTLVAATFAQTQAEGRIGWVFKDVQTLPGLLGDAAVLHPAGAGLLRDRVPADRPHHPGDRGQQWQRSRPGRDADRRRDDPVEP